MVTYYRRNASKHILLVDARFDKDTDPISVAGTDGIDGLLNRGVISSSGFIDRDSG